MFPSSSLVVVMSILSAIVCRFVSVVVVAAGVVVVVGLACNDGGGGARNEGRRGYARGGAARIDAGVVSSRLADALYMVGGGV